MIGIRFSHVFVQRPGSGASDSNQMASLSARLAFELARQSSLLSRCVIHGLCWTDPRSSTYASCLVTLLEAKKGQQQKKAKQASNIVKA